MKEIELLESVLDADAARCDDNRMCRFLLLLLASDVVPIKRKLLERWGRRALIFLSQQVVAVFLLIFALYLASDYKQTKGDTVSVHNGLSKQRSSNFELPK